MDLAVASLGRIEVYFNSYVVIQTIKALCATEGIAFAELVEKHPKLKILYNFAKDLNKLQARLSSNLFAKDVYKKYEALRNCYLGT